MAQNFHLDIASDKDEGGRWRRGASEGLGKDQKAIVHAILLQALEILLFQMPPVIEANLRAIFWRIDFKNEVKKSCATGAFHVMLF